MAETLRVVIADDQPLMRAGLRTLLELETDIEVVGEASDGREAVAEATRLRPDVVLMDVQMPHLNGIEATRTLRAQRPEARVLILTTFEDERYVFEGLGAGASGYLLKDVSGEELAAAVRTVAAGGAVIGPAVAGKVLGRVARPPSADPTGEGGLLEPLNERELEILAAIADGLSNPAIARRLGLAEGTVKNYVSRILQKTGSEDRTQAALRARDLGLI
jgi:DNA-binding NarL/FixJ family response regulator